MEGNVVPTRWRAIYKSGETLEQENTTVDVLFDNIDKENLRQFHLLGYPIEVGVDLEKGCLILNGSEVCLKGFSGQKSNFRLIYYVNLKQIAGSSREPEKTYCLGMQTSLGGKNSKVRMILSKNGLFVDYSKIEK